MSTLFVNGHLHTVDPDLPAATAMLVTGNRITWVGDTSEAPQHPGAELVDLAGRTVLPGFIDAHNHVRLGSDEACVQLGGSTGMDDVRRRIEEWRLQRPDAGWVECEGYEYVGLVGGAMPTARDLDALVDDVPAVVFSYDVHTVWLNSLALKALDITADRIEPAFGTAQVDRRGEPTGFVNDFAVKGLSRAGMAALQDLGLPWADPARQYARLCDSLDRAIACGITTVVEPQNSVDDLALFDRARAEGRLRSRLIAALFHPRGTTAATRTEFARLAEAYRSADFTVGPLKLYIDDVVEPHTAAMHEPYANDPQNRGRTYYAPAEFAELLATLDAEGFQAFVHATGDRGITTVLDAVEHARAVNGVRDARHQVVHVECLRDSDLPRFAGLGVVACMQPRHCSPDIAGPGHDWADAVGEGRWPNAWPMGSLERAGATLAFSSDWNVAEMEPMIGIYTAVTRQGLAGGPSWMPQESVDRTTAIHAYTMGSAYANFCEHERGSLTPGKLADFAIFDEDPFEVPAQTLWRLRVAQTWVDGELRYRAPEV